MTAIYKTIVFGHEIDTSMDIYLVNTAATTHAAKQIIRARAFVHT